MNNCLLVDFGSTFTKLTAVNLITEEIIGTCQSETTVSTDIMEGYYSAKEKLLKEVQQPDLIFDYQLACSSAKGGFKMVAIGLSPSLTTEAAKRVALGAGTRVLNVYSYGLTEEKAQEIKTLQPDVILLCGGTNGGNQKGIIQDASILKALNLSIPIVISGNEESYPSIKRLFRYSKQQIHFTENLMPQINRLNPEPTRTILRQIFMEQIIQAKGLEKVTTEIDQLLMPTPNAVLKGASLLSKGTEATQGIGDLIVIDIGGATTDIHSIGEGRPISHEIRMEGLEEPFEKRTVEGDLGMRYSAISLFESVTYEGFNPFTTLSREEIKRECQKRASHPNFVPHSFNEKEFDDVLGKIATQTAIKRHAGHYRREPTPNRVLFYQTGKNLCQFKFVIGTGGILVNNQKPFEILSACIGKKSEMNLMPINPNFLLDQAYILSSMGLLASKEPDIALRILKKYLLPLQ